MDSLYTKKTAQVKSYVMKANKSVLETLNNTNNIENLDLDALADTVKRLILFVHWIYRDSEVNSVELRYDLISLCCTTLLDLVCVQQQKNCTQSREKIRHCADICSYFFENQLEFLCDIVLYAERITEPNKTVPKIFVRKINELLKLNNTEVSMQCLMKLIVLRSKLSRIFGSFKGEIELNKFLAARQIKPVKKWLKRNGFKNNANFSSLDIFSKSISLAQCERILDVLAGAADTSINVVSKNDVQKTRTDHFICTDSPSIIKGTANVVGFIDATRADTCSISTDTDVPSDIVCSERPPVSKTESVCAQNAISATDSETSQIEQHDHPNTATGALNVLGGENSIENLDKDDKRETDSLSVASTEVFKIDENRMDSLLDDETVGTARLDQPAVVSADEHNPPSSPVDIFSTTVVDTLSPKDQASTVTETGLIEVEQKENGPTTNYPASEDIKAVEEPVGCVAQEMSFKEAERENDSVSPELGVSLPEALSPVFRRYAVTNVETTSNTEINLERRLEIDLERRLEISLERIVIETEVDNFNGEEQKVGNEQFIKESGGAATEENKTAEVGLDVINGSQVNDSIQGKENLISNQLIDKQSSYPHSSEHVSFGTFKTMKMPKEERDKENPYLFGDCEVLLSDSMSSEESIYQNTTIRKYMLRKVKAEDETKVRSVVTGKVDRSIERSKAKDKLQSSIITYIRNRKPLVRSLFTPTRRGKSPAATKPSSSAKRVKQPIVEETVDVADSSDAGSLNCGTSKSRGKRVSFSINDDSVVEIVRRTSTMDADCLPTATKQRRLSAQKSKKSVNDSRPKSQVSSRTRRTPRYATRSSTKDNMI